MSLRESLVWQLLWISLLEGLRYLCSSILWHHQGTLVVWMYGRGKWLFLYFVWYLSVIYPQSTHLRTSVWLSKHPCSFLDQIMPILCNKNILGLKYSPLKRTTPKMRSLSTIWLKMSRLIRSVSDHGKCGIKLKVSTMEVHSCVVVVLSMLPWQRKPRCNQKQRKNGHFCNLCDT